MKFRWNKQAAVVMIVCIGSILTAGCGQSSSEESKKEEKAYYTEYGFSDESDVYAFPEAEGYGKETVGGRGGKVIEVTNLNDSGEGSLRAAVEAKGPRTVVFRVSGNIYLESMLTITEPNITIAGQTAPGDGICLVNFGLVVDTEQAIVRYIRCRPGGSEETDALWVKDSKQVVIDHVSASWGTDETLSVSSSDKVTVQNCIISESLNMNNFGTHGMGSLIRGSHGQCVTYARNVVAIHRSRMPMAGNYTSYKEDPEGFKVELINNLFYNWSGESAGKNHDVDTITQFNLINNVYVPGRVSVGNYAWSEGCSYTKMYMEGNCMDGSIPDDQWSLVEIEADNTNFSWDNYKLSERFKNSQYEAILDTEAVRETLTADAGASFSRDEIDTAVIASIDEKKTKLINKPEESVGWSGAYPELKSEEAPVDTDKDGIPDDWEKKVGLDAENAEDGAADSGCGYTNLEIYLQAVLMK